MSAEQRSRWLEMLSIAGARAKQPRDDGGRFDSFAEAKNYDIHIRATAAEWRRLHAVARYLGVSMSAYIHALVRISDVHLTLDD